MRLPPIHDKLENDRSPHWWFQQTGILEPQRRTDAFHNQWVPCSCDVGGKNPLKRQGSVQSWPSCKSLHNKQLFACLFLAFCWQYDPAKHLILTQQWPDGAEASALWKLQEAKMLSLISLLHPLNGHTNLSASQTCSKARWSPANSFSSHAARGTKGSRSFTKREVSSEALSPELICKRCCHFHFSAEQLPPHPPL